MIEDKWLRSEIISSRGISEIIKILSELYPEYSFVEVERKAKEGLIPNPFILENSDVEAERALAGLIHREQAYLFLSYIQAVLEEASDQLVEELAAPENIDKLLLVGADALAHAILILINIDKMREIALNSAPLLAQIVPVSILLKRDKMAETVLTLIFAMLEKPDRSEDKLELANALAMGFEEANLNKIAVEIREHAKRLVSDK